VKKALLILLAVLLPLQTIAAAERAFAHAIEGRAKDGFQLSHLVEHAEHIQHHHDDDGDEHGDDSAASAQHMLDHDHAFGTGFMVPASVQMPEFPAHLKPTSFTDVLTSRTTEPPLRPPPASA